MLKKVLFMALGVLRTVFVFGCATSGTGEYQSEPPSQAVGGTTGPSVDVSGVWNVVSMGPTTKNNQIFHLIQKGHSIRGRTISPNNS